MTKWGSQQGWTYDQFMLFLARQGNTSVDELESTYIMCPIVRTGALGNGPQHRWRGGA